MTYPTKEAIRVALDVAVEMLENISKGGSYSTRDYMTRLLTIKTVLVPLNAEHQALHLIQSMAQDTIETWDAKCTSEPVFHGGSIRYSEDDETTLSQLVVRIAHDLDLDR